MNYLEQYKQQRDNATIVWKGAFAEDNNGNDLNPNSRPATCDAEWDEYTNELRFFDVTCGEIELTGVTREAICEALGYDFDSNGMYEAAKFVEFGTYANYMADIADLDIDEKDLFKFIDVEIYSKLGKLV